MTSVAEARPKYVFDGHKLPWHTDRVAAWEAGERIAPVTVDMALSRACQLACRNCYASVQEPQERRAVTLDHALALADDFAEIGVRGVSLISDGESTLSKAYVPFVQRLYGNGIDVGNATNGLLLTPERAEAVLPCLTWVRFTVLAGTPESYGRLMVGDPKRSDLFDTAVGNIRACVGLKRHLGLGVTLGIQTFVTPDDVSEIGPFVRLALELGVDYAMVKHTSDDEYGSLGVRYGSYEALHAALREAEAMGTERTRVVVKWRKIRDGDRTPYQRAYGPVFLLQISGSGLVAPAGQFFNARYSKLHIGNFTEERFRDIFKSERYWAAMNYLAGPAFDARTMMGTLPIQHYCNVALDRHVRGEERVTPAEEPVMHRNFL